jgi:predicted DNA-binding mobile mystery protein A
MDAFGEARKIVPPQPERGWLRAVRTTLGLSQAHVAAKASMTRQAYADLEAAEERGAISLNSLRRAAEAMDAEFAYSVAPRTAVQEALDSKAASLAADGSDLPVELR